MSINDKECKKINRHYNRVKERHFWVKFGIFLFLSGLFTIFLFTGFTFLGIIIFQLVSIGLTATFFGAFSFILFGRLGWSESMLIDFLLNRLSIILIIVGLGLMSLRLNSTIHFERNYYVFFFIAGTILALFGMLFRSPIPDDPRIIRD